VHFGCGINNQETPGGSVQGQCYIANCPLAFAFISVNLIYGSGLHI